VFQNTNFGKMLFYKKNISMFQKELKQIMNYIGILDAYINIYHLHEYHDYCIPEYDFTNDKPYIDAYKLRNPLLSYGQVKNNCALDKNMIITGANMSGKSTYMRNCMLSVYLSQTICIAPCDKITFTPFHHLFTYMNIPDVVGKESLFEAEINRCLNYINYMKDLDKNKFVFGIIDELFTGTSPNEGVAGSFAVCEYLSKYDNLLLELSTHFHKLTKLQELYPYKFINKMFYVKSDDENEFVRDYKIYDGISTQNLAFDLLLYKGYDPELVMMAYKSMYY